MVDDRQTGQGVEFLDVFYQIKDDDPVGFVTKKFHQTKSSRTYAFTQKFISFTSYFEGIIFSEAVKFHRLNKRHKDYTKKHKGTKR